MDAITQHHFHNIAYGKAKRLDNGDLATVNTIIKEIDGVETLIPTVWDGQIVDEETAVNFAIQSGVEWPTRTGPNAVEELDAFDRDIHTEFTDQTSQEEAAGILIDTFGYPDAGTEMTVPGGKLILSNETFESGSPMWDFVADEPVDSLLAPLTSTRPEPRPSPEYFANKELLKAQKDEDELYEYKAEQNKIEYEKAFGEEEPSMFAENKFRLGGFATANRGITTTEGLDMAKQKFQLDRKEADRNGDGELSDYEETTGEAIQKAMADVDDPEQDEKANLYHGGMACGDGIMSDPESGNPIPIGSSAENVRDDIEAMISEGEYVLPANVVKWHGLRHIMEMQSEAEMGLMSMNEMGLIQYASEEGEEEPEEVSEDQEDVPSEDVDIEVAAVMVDDKLDDDDEIEEIYPDTSYTPGAFQKQKVVFMS